MKHLDEKASQTSPHCRKIPPPPASHGVQLGQELGVLSSFIFTTYKLI